MAEKRKKQSAAAKKRQVVKPKAEKKAIPVSKQMIEFLTLIGKGDLMSVRRMLRDSDPAYTLPQGVVARFIVAGMGYVDIRGRSDMQNLKPFIKATGQNIHYIEVNRITESMSEPDQPGSEEIDEIDFG